MSAAGKVCTGFSKPYVALYGNNNGTVSYTSGQKLARGVSVSLDPNASDPSIFYCDNITGESIPGGVSNGTLTLTVDGLLAEARKLVAGLPTADADGWTHYGDSQSIPNVGIGFIVRYMSDGVTYYTPVVITKATLQPESLSAETQGEEVDFQTEELVFNFVRDDSANHDWKLLGTDQSTESAAETALQTLLGVSVTPPVVS